MQKRGSVAVPGTAWGPGLPWPGHGGCRGRTGGVEELRCVVDSHGNGDGQGVALSLDHGHAAKMVQPYLRHLPEGAGQRKRGPCGCSQAWAAHLAR